MRKNQSRNLISVFCVAHVSSLIALGYASRADDGWTLVVGRALLTRIAHQFAADFVRSRAVAVVYVHISEEFCRTLCRATPGARAQCGLMSQFDLLAMWIALGKSRYRIRKTLLLLLAAGFLGALAEFDPRAAASNFEGLRSVLLKPPLFAILGTLAAEVMAAPWEMLQRRGFDLVDISDAPQSGCDAGFQFSLRQSFAWTTVVAMLIAIDRLTAPLAEAYGNASR
ncbi:MAG TPA: hypothetical protein VMV10_06875 [Pirellulales bacterium]|nr:hypothetical protein [Pirellulales bacterium]